MIMYLLAAAVVLGLWLMTTYNGLVKLRNLMQEGCERHRRTTEKAFRPYS